VFHIGSTNVITRSYNCERNKNTKFLALSKNYFPYFDIKKGLALHLRHLKEKKLWTTLCRRTKIKWKKRQGRLWPGG
jgi:hypothetical protein